MDHVEAFLIPVPRAELDRYLRDVEAMAPLWREYGALSFVQAVADNAPWGDKTSFPRAVELRADEVVVLAWMTFPDRAARDRAVELSSSDPRGAALTAGWTIDRSRMIFGGFEVAVSA